MHAIGILFFIVLVIAALGLITVLVFGFRLVRGVVRGIVWMLSSIFGDVESAARRRIRQPQVKAMACPRSRCHAENAAQARFCRRCGVPMDRRFEYAQRRPVSRSAAMW